MGICVANEILNFRIRVHVLAVYATMQHAVAWGEALMQGFSYEGISDFLNAL